jgi:peptidoglycan hydrolase CwlO-like protein
MEPTGAGGLKCEQLHADSIRTHIADIPPNVQNLLADEFERKVITLRAKLEAKYAEIKKDKNRLAALNREQSAEIDHLRTALEEASSKAVEQNRRISLLESEIASERDSHEGAEQANSECADGIRESLA